MKKFFGYLVAAVMICGLSVGTTVFVLRNVRPNVLMGTTVQGDSVSVPVAYAKFAHVPAAGETDLTVAAELSVNAVVHVKTTYPAPRQSFSADPFFEFFFGRPERSQQSIPQQRGSGSGVIISTDGYIVTNNHVIAKAESIEVVLNDKRKFTARLVGTDPNTDIALLKIEATELPVILMGNSDELRVGEWVLAVGNPFNLTSTVTAGIVSAKARNINILNAEMKIESFIQTDAAVNPGNSGGALVNTRGELVGINTAIASQTGSYAGYSFAVPTGIVQKVVGDIKQFGIVQRAILGVQLQEITQELQAEKGLTTLQGAYVARVMADGAAEKAGVRDGDVITQVNAAPIKTVTDLQEQIGRYRPGDSVTITVLRNGELHTLTAVLTNKSGTTKLVEKSQEGALLGAEFAPLDAKMKHRLGVEYGLQITRLEHGKLRAAGIPKDFVILKVNNRPIHTEADLRAVYEAALAADKNDQVLFMAGVLPNGRVGYFAINLSE